MRTAAITLAMTVGFGVFAEASLARPVVIQPVTPQITPATAPAGGSNNGSGFILPQVAPPAILPPGASPQGLGKPDARSGMQVGRRFEPPRGRVCFSQSETRENIASHRLSEPISALRAGRQQGEALRARLCRWKPDEFVYEVSVLHRDGRVLHIYMNARSGQIVGALNDNERK